MDNNNKGLRVFAIKTVKLLAAAAFILFAYRCPIRTITGVSCPGCGLKRAFMFALKLDFMAAWNSHPLFVLIGAELLYLIMVCYFPKMRINKTAELIIAIATIILLFTVWIYRR